MRLECKSSKLHVPAGTIARGWTHSLTDIQRVVKLMKEPMLLQLLLLGEALQAVGRKESAARPWIYVASTQLL